MSDELKKFSSQITFALQNYREHDVLKELLNEVLICGMGGSGIAGRIVKDYFYGKISMPINVVSDYVLPHYAGSNTLVILCSYSGNTEETLAAYDIAKEKECQIIVITTGGTLLDKAKKDENTFFLVEPGCQPRMALGTPLTYLFLIIFQLEGLHKKRDLDKIAASLNHVNDYIMNAEELAQQYKTTANNKFVVVCDPYFEGIATRFCQQIQENAKQEAFVCVLPEANHNVIESYYQKRNTNFIFLNSRMNHRTNLRFSFLKDLLEKQGLSVNEMIVNDTSINTIYQLIYLMDWLALQIADILGSVSNQIPNINALKEFLEKQKQ